MESVDNSKENSVEEEKKESVEKRNTDSSQRVCYIWLLILFLHSMYQLQSF